MADIVVTSYDIALALLLSLRPWRFRLPLIAYCGLDIVSVFATLSRGGILSLLLGTLGLLSLKRLKWYYSAAIIATVVGSVAVGIFLLPDETREERSGTEAGTSAGARPYLWSLCFAIINENPLRTWGWGNKPKSSTGFIATNFCNWLLQDFMEAGFLEAAVSVGIFGYAIWIALQNHKRLPAGSPGRMLNTTAIVIILSRYFHGSLEAYWDAIYEHAIVYYLLGYLTYTQLQVMRRTKYTSIAENSDRY